MSQRPVREWAILITYIFILIILTVHSGYLCQKLWFVVRQFVPVAVAGVLAFVLNHPYKYVCSFYTRQMRLSEKAARVGSVFTVYLSLVGTVTAAGRYILPRFVEGLRQFVANRESYIQAFEMSLQQLALKIGADNLDLSPVSDGILNYLGRVDELMEVFVYQMARLTTGAIRSVVGVGIILVLSAYILYDKKHLKKQIYRFYKAYIPEQYNPMCLQFAGTVIESFDNFIVGQGLESLVLGVLCFLGMIVLRLEYSGFVSFVVGVTAFIPFFGAYIGGGLGTGLLLFVSVKKAITFLIFFVILQQIENNLIYPRVVGKRTGLPGLWVIAAVTVGGGLYGVLGMIFSVPTATIIYSILKRSVEIRESQKRAKEDEIQNKAV